MTLNAIVRVRGIVGVKHTLKMALKMLNLERVNWMALVKDDPASVGQLVKVQDFATFGKINSAVLSKVLEKRGMLPGDKPITKEFLASIGFKSFQEFANALIEGKTDLRKAGVKPFFRLHPP
ncbi:MAG: uL30 family ribosomal protein, partial [Candidatus Diapherotrites archaeon]|nr:uL30 family ribosomal protein [Candidatus Diapherotrites archaeon]